MEKRVGGEPMLLTGFGVMASLFRWYRPCDSLPFSLMAFFGKQYSLSAGRQACPSVLCILKIESEGHPCEGWRWERGGIRGYAAAGNRCMKKRKNCTGFYPVQFLALENQYIPPMPPAPPAGAAGSGSLISTTSASVVRTVEATDAAFWSAHLDTLVGSMMPASNISTYFSL